MGIEPFQPAMLGRVSVSRFTGRWHWTPSQPATTRQRYAAIPSAVRAEAGKIRCYHSNASAAFARNGRENNSEKHRPRVVARENKRIQREVVARRRVRVTVF